MEPRPSTRPSTHEHRRTTPIRTAATSIHRSRASASGRCGSASAGPVGSGKTTLVGALCRLLRDELSLAVVTNDIFTTEDARPCAVPACSPRSGSSPSRPAAARTPRSATTSPPTSTRSRSSRRSTPDAVDLTLVESGGDNLTADVQPRPRRRADLRARHRRRRRRARARAAPAWRSADLLVINKVDLAPLRRRRRRPDARRRRRAAGRPAGAADVARRCPGAAPIADWIRGELAAWRRAGLTASVGT